MKYFGEGCHIFVWFVVSGYPSYSHIVRIYSSSFFGLCAIYFRGALDHGMKTMRCSPTRRASWLISNVRSLSQDCHDLRPPSSRFDSRRRECLVAVIVHPLNRFLRGLHRTRCPAGSSCAFARFTVFQVVFHRFDFLAVSTSQRAMCGTVAARWCLLIFCCLRRSPSPLLGSCLRWGIVGSTSAGCRPQKTIHVFLSIE